MSTIRDNLFFHAVSHLEYSRTTKELDETLDACIKASQETMKPSTITLTLTVKPKNNGAQVFIIPEIKSKIPKFPREETIFFPNDGNLLRNDPHQNNIPGMKIVEDNFERNFNQA